MEELTSDQEKGFEILTRALRRKFPYIKGIKLDRGTPYHIYINIIVEFFSFLKYYKAKPTDFYLKYGASGIESYFKDNNKSSYTFLMVDPEFNDEFSTPFNKNMEKIINTLYDSLPKHYIKFKEDWYEESPMDIKIDEYYVTVDKSEETPTLRDMLDPDYEQARKVLYSPD